MTHTINDCYAVAASQCGKHGLFEASDFLYGCANAPRPAEDSTKRTFPIPTNCTKCGHRGDLFVSDESLKADLDAYAKGRMLVLWRPLMVRRMIASWAVVFTLGIALGLAVSR